MSVPGGYPLRVLLADSHVTVRSALRRLLDEEPGMQLAGEVTRARELLARAQSLQPDVVLLEWELPGLDTDEAKPERQPSAGNMRRLFYDLHTLSSHPQLVVLSGWPQAQKFALLAGADAFVSKGSPPLTLLVTLRRIAGLREVHLKSQDGNATGRQPNPNLEATMNIKNYRKVKAEDQEPGITLRWLISELEDAPNVTMKLYELAPGAVGPVHTHAWEDEIFVLRGTGAVVGPDGEVAIGEGDVLYIPPRERHQFVNKGERELCLLMAVPQSEQVTLAAGIVA